MNDALLQQVAKLYGTPTYVYDLAIVREQAVRIRSALPEAELLFAVKANPSRAVLRQLAALEFGAEVITLGELERAHRAAIPARRILLGGPGQDETLIERALEAAVGWVSLDSPSQWELWRQLMTGRGPSAKEALLPRFLVRINPQLDPHTHPHLATGAPQSKFGMTPSEGRLAAAELQDAGLLSGFHFHIGSQIASPDSYRPLERLAAQLFAEHPGVDTLDLGGGFAVPDFPLGEFADFAGGLADRLGVKLVLEPGRFVVAQAGVLLTSVRHVKKGAVDHVIADAGMAELLRPALYGADHPVRRVGDPAGTSMLSTVDLDGPLCENADRLARQVLLPAGLRRGDLLVVEQAGAYGMSMASNYGSSLRPAEVVIDGDELRLVRARETVDDLLRIEFA